MPAFDVQERWFHCAQCGRTFAHVANPHMRAMKTIFVFDRAFDDEQFFSTVETSFAKVRTARQTHELVLLGAVFVEWTNVHAIAMIEPSGIFAPIDPHEGLVIGKHPPQLDENDASRIGMGRVPGAYGVAHVKPSGIIAVFVGKNAFEDEKLFASAMGMGAESASGSITDDAGDAGDFLAITFEHAAIDARHGGGDPGLGGAIDAGIEGEVGVEFHRVGCGPSWPKLRLLAMK